MKSDFFNLIGYKIGLSHYIYHCAVALAIMGLVMAVTNGNYIAGAWSGAIFYWSRELAQYEIRKTHFEWKCAIYPTVAVSIVATLISYLV